MEQNMLVHIILFLILLPTALFRKTEGGKMNEDNDIQNAKDKIVSMIVKDMQELKSAVIELKGDILSHLSANPPKDLSYTDKREIKYVLHISDNILGMTLGLGSAVVFLLLVIVFLLARMRTKNAAPTYIVVEKAPTLKGASKFKPNRDMLKRQDRVNDDSDSDEDDGDEHDGCVEFPRENGNDENENEITESPKKSRKRNIIGIVMLLFLMLSLCLVLTLINTRITNESSGREYNIYYNGTDISSNYTTIEYSSLQPQTTDVFIIENSKGILMDNKELVELT